MSQKWKRWARTTKSTRLSFSFFLFACNAESPCFRGQGEGLRGEVWRPKLLSSCRPPFNTGLPTPPRFFAYVRVLAILSIRSGGAWGVLDAWVTPRVSAALAAPPPLRFSRPSTLWLCSSWSSSPGQKPISPALPRVSLQLPRQPAPSVRPPSVTCASRRVLGTPSHYSCVTRKSSPTGSGDPLPVGTHTQFRLKTCTGT